MKRVFGFLQSVGFVPSSDLESQPGADEIVPIYFEAVTRFAEPLVEGKTETLLRSSVHANLTHLDQLLRSLPSSEPNVVAGRPEIACTKGCHYCCSIRVTTTAPIVIALAVYLRKKLSAEVVSILVTRLEEYSKESNRLNPVELLSKNRMCPLNADGVCLGYEYRPHGCRTHHSLDVKACERASKDGLTDAVIPQDSTRYELQSIVLRAYSDCLDSLGLNHQELEFIPALALALNDPNIGEKYISGETVFDSAHRPEVLDFQRSEMRRLGLTMLRQISP